MNLYVGTLPDRVNVYDAAASGDAVPLRSIHGPSTGLDGVADVAHDALGNLYVANAANSTINVYDPAADGDAAPIRVLAGASTGLGVPISVALDSGGNLYVLNTGGLPANHTITVYSPGASGDVAPLRTLTGIQVGDGNVMDIAIDQFDFLYLSEDLPEFIQVYPPGAGGPVVPVRTLSGPTFVVPAKMGFDVANNLYVAIGVGVLVFAPGANGRPAPLRTIQGPSTGISNAFDLAVDQAGVLYVANWFIATETTPGSVTVTVYDPGADGDAAPARTISGVDTQLGTLPGGIAVDEFARAQANWRWCNKCQGLFFAGNPTTGYCPAGGGHDFGGSGNYALAIAPGPGQDNWRWCNKCQGLFFAGNPTTGSCPAGGGHDFGESGDYAVAFAPGTGQANWRWCNKCQGLFFAGNPTTGYCPAGGGHDYDGSGDYVLASS
jgi:hypothetical protein